MNRCINGANCVRSNWTRWISRAVVLGGVVLSLSLAVGCSDDGDDNGSDGGGTPVVTPTPGPDPTGPLTRPNAPSVTYTGSRNGTVYSLKVVEVAGAAKRAAGAAYTPKAADAFELSVGVKKSTGFVSSVSGTDLTLKPSHSEASPTFTATVSGEDDLVGVAGTITFTDGTTTQGPGTFASGNEEGPNKPTMPAAAKFAEYGITTAVPSLSGTLAKVEYDDDTTTIIWDGSNAASFESVVEWLEANGYDGEEIVNGGAQVYSADKTVGNKIITAEVMFSSTSANFFNLMANCLYLIFEPNDLPVIDIPNPNDQNAWPAAKIQNMVGMALPEYAGTKTGYTVQESSPLLPDKQISVTANGVTAPQDEQEAYNELLEASGFTKIAANAYTKPLGNGNAVYVQTQWGQNVLIIYARVDVENLGGDDDDDDEDDESYYRELCEEIYEEHEFDDVEACMAFFR